MTLEGDNMRTTSVRVWTLALLSAGGCTATAVAELVDRTGTDSIAEQKPVIDSGAEAPSPPVPPEQVVSGDWPVRACSLSLRYRPTAPVAQVLVAGPFTGWGAQPWPLEGPNADGVFAITLQPSSELEPGHRYAYRFIVDGQWSLDPEAALQAFDGECLNSAFEMPACTLRPEVTVQPVQTHYDPVTGNGAATIHFQVHLALDETPVSEVTLSLNEETVPEHRIQADRMPGAFTLELTDLDLGRHMLQLRVVDAQGRHALPVDLPLWIETEPFDWRDTVLYMMVVDRFANGDRSQDGPIGGSVSPPADWHGGDLQGALEVLRSGYFEKLGVRAIWLSPINQQAEGAFKGRDDQALSAAYHGYWPTRGRTVEPRFGGNAALRAFVDEAHRRGIRVLLDLINNQIHEQHEYYAAHPEWFRTGCVCGIDRNCGWSERPFDCLFADYLPDINWRVPEAEHQLIEDALSWIAAYGIDGFRIDAVKHVESNSIFNLRAALDQRFGKGGTRMLLLGETAVTASDRFTSSCGIRYNSGYEWINATIGPHGLDGQFDFPTHHQLQWGLLTNRMGFEELETILGQAEQRYAHNRLNVFFLGTHDSPRMASRAAEDPARDCKWPAPGRCAIMPRRSDRPETYARLRRAFTLLMTGPAIPFLYAGDELGLPGGNDPDNRRDMLWPDELQSVALDSTPPTAQQQALLAWIQRLGQARRMLPALRQGRREALVATPTLWVSAFFGSRPTDLVLVAINRGPAVDRLVLRGLTEREVQSLTRFDSLVGPLRAEVTDGGITLSIAAGESGVLVAR